MSNIRCCFCGRVTLNPAAFIGTFPVGSTCARKHLLTEARLRGRAHAVRFVKGGGRQHAAQRDTKTLDLFGSAP